MKQVCVFLIFISGITAGYGQNALLWEISGNGLEKPSYLFGTMHLYCDGDMPGNDSIFLCLENAEVLVKETDEDKIGLVKAIRLSRMNGDTTLKQLYTPEEYEELKRYFDTELDMNLDLLQNMKPTMISSFVLIRMLPCNIKETSGSERELSAWAKESDIPIEGLESPEYQAGLLDSIPYKTQAAELLKMIRDTEKTKRGLNAMIRYYRNGQLDSLYRVATEDTVAFNAMDEILLRRRNENWVRLLSESMKARTCFIAVGAAHLPGEGGLIALLRKQGYILRPIKSVE